MKGAPSCVPMDEPVLVRDGEAVGDLESDG